MKANELVTLEHFEKRNQYGGQTKLFLATDVKKVAIRKYGLLAGSSEDSEVLEKGEELWNEWKEKYVYARALCILTDIIADTQTMLQRHLRSQRSKVLPRKRQKSPRRTNRSGLLMSKSTTLMTRSCPRSQRRASTRPTARPSFNSYPETWYVYLTSPSRIQSTAILRSFSTERTSRP